MVKSPSHVLVALIFYDFAAHPKTHVFEKLFFLPKITSKTQPMNQGAIQNFFYRQQLALRRSVFMKRRQIFMSTSIIQ